MASLVPAPPAPPAPASRPDHEWVVALGIHVFADAVSTWHHDNATEANTAVWAALAGLAKTRLGAPGSADGSGVGSAASEDLEFVCVVVSGNDGVSLFYAVATTSPPLKGADAGDDAGGGDDSGAEVDVSVRMATAKRIARAAADEFRAFAEREMGLTGMEVMMDGAARAERGVDSAAMLFAAMLADVDLSAARSSLALGLTDLGSQTRGGGFGAPARSLEELGSRGFVLSDDSDEFAETAATMPLSRHRGRDFRGVLQTGGGLRTPDDDEAETPAAARERSASAAEADDRSSSLSSSSSDSDGEGEQAQAKHEIRKHKRSFPAAALRDGKEGDEGQDESERVAATGHSLHASDNDSDNGEELTSAGWGDEGGRRVGADADDDDEFYAGEADDSDQALVAASLGLDAAELQAVAASLDPETLPPAAPPAPPGAPVPTGAGSGAEAGLSDVPTYDEFEPSAPAEPVYDEFEPRPPVGVADRHAAGVARRALAAASGDGDDAMYRDFEPDSPASRRLLAAGPGFEYSRPGSAYRGIGIGDGGYEGDMDGSGAGAGEATTTLRTRAAPDVPSLQRAAAHRLALSTAASRGADDAVPPGGVAPRSSGDSGATWGGRVTTFARHALPSNPYTGDGAVEDAVHFNAYGPRATPAGTWFQLALWAYMRAQFREMHERATSKGDTIRGTSDHWLRVRRGQWLTLSLEVPAGFEAASTTAELCWTGNVDAAHFNVLCRDDAAPGAHRLKVTVVYGDTVATLSVAVIVAAKGAARSTGATLGGIGHKVDDLYQLDTELEVLEHRYNKIPLAHIDIVKELGSGQGGTAFLGTVGDSSAAVARDVLRRCGAYIGGGGGRGGAGAKPTVVFKEIRSASSASSGGEAATRELEHEAAVHSMAGHHPNIVTLVGAVVDTPSQMGVVMEYCPRGSLDVVIAASGADTRSGGSSQSAVGTGASALLSTTADKVAVLTDAARGLSAAHAARLIHRDIAARNCLIGEDLSVKIGDFGLGTVLPPRGEDFVVIDGKQPLRIAAPECLRHPHEFSRRSDTYAMGMLCYEVFAGHGPFEGIVDEDTLIAAVVGGERPAVPPGMPREVAELMRECVAADQYARPAMARVYDTLRRINAAGAGSRTPVGGGAEGAGFGSGELV